VGKSGSLFDATVWGRRGGTIVNVAMTKLTSLIEVSDSIPCIIDVQDFFLARIETAAAKRLVERIQWLVRVATWLDVGVNNYPDPPIVGEVANFDIISRPREVGLRVAFDF
jgi:hypothetical protein